jgi:TolB-like protein
MIGTPHLPRLHFLGGFRLTGAEGEDVRLSSRKAKALLAVVALAPGQSVTRARLRALLWSDRGEDQASASLRQLLVVLRKQLAPLGPHLLWVRDDSIGLDPGALDIDTHRFFAAEAAGDAGQSVAIYEGPLLDGLDLCDQAFEDWLGAERRNFLSRAILMFEARAAELTGEARVAMAQRLVALDPLRETSHQALIASYLANGETALARKQFETCRTMLARELGVAPAAETEALLVKPLPVARAAKPTIAVLPLANLSDDSAQRYFSDGITADIVTELSRFHQLLVRAAKSKPDAGGLDAGRELAVQYVAEGSVRRFGKRIRITVQLLDVETGQNLWAERFDAGEEEIFEVQDKIVRSIAAQLSDRLRIAAVEKASRKPPTNLAAYECFLQADALPIGVPEAAAEARRLCQKAIDLDSSYGRAHAFLADSYTLEWLHHLDAPDSLLDKALHIAKKAVALDEGDDFCHAMLARAYLYRNSHDLAEFHYLKALAINPNHSTLNAGLGIFYGFRGDPARALSYFREALALNPHNTPTWYWRNRAVVHFIAHEYEQAIEGFRRSPIQPDWVEAFLAASYAHLGRMEEARQHAAASLRLTPNLTIAAFLKKEPHRHREDAEHVAEGLRKAGIPD